MSESASAPFDVFDANDVFENAEKSVCRFKSDNASENLDFNNLFSSPK